MSRITDVAGTDFLSVGAFEDLVNTVRQECWDNTSDLGSIASTLIEKLEQVPEYDPKTRQERITRRSLANAREVGGYFRRAATSQTACAAEIASAWVLYLQCVELETGTAKTSPTPLPHGAFQGIPRPTGAIPAPSGRRRR